MNYEEVKKAFTFDLDTESLKNIIEKVIGMEYVTVEFYFDESKDKTSLDKARVFIMELFNKKGLSCIKNNDKNIIYKDNCDKYGKFWWALDNLADNIAVVDCLSEAYFIFEDKEDVLNKFLRVVV